MMKFYIFSTILLAIYVVSRYDVMYGTNLGGSKTRRSTTQPHW